MKSTRFTLGRAALFLSAVLFVAVSITACSPDFTMSTEQNVETITALDPLVGDWKDGDESYVITQETFTSSYKGSLSYSGNDLKVLKISDSMGYIYIKYTMALDAEYKPSATARDVGRWYAIFYKNLTDSSISLSGAYGSKDGHKKTSTATLREAVAEFTVENGYFGYFSDLAK